MIASMVKSNRVHSRPWPDMVGSGTVCRVHQPKRPKSVCDPAQTAALEATRMKLGLTCMDGNHKRKLDDFLSAESEDGENE